ncbi:MAG: arginase family protein [Elusimicrobiales bacterium]|nr:arginase family protein [Elusimicrobiales bacterium]
MRKIYVFDIPTSAGCLHEGTELSAGHFRQNGIINRLAAKAGVEVHDLGGVPLPQGRRHNDHPVRNWPLPETAWRQTGAFMEKIGPAVKDRLCLCLGGDCSIIVGTTAGMAQWHGNDKVHVISLDGNVDSISPLPDTCCGSAGMGLWMATQKSDYWPGGKLPTASITVIGNQEKPANDIGIPCVSLGELRERGIAKSVKAALAAIAKERKLLLHFDVDVIAADAMPAAYMPREARLSLCETGQILKLLLQDDRTAFLEITEFMPSKDPQGRHAKALIELLCAALAS